MDANQALKDLMGKPQSFLKYYPVKCAGSTAPLQGMVNTKKYYLNKQGAGMPTIKGEVLGHRGAIRVGRFGRKHEISSFMLSPNITPGAATINSAHIVPMVNYNSDIYGAPNLHANTAAMPHYVLDATGDGIMVTGELSACCFCFYPYQGKLLCTHVQPREGITASALQLELATRGHFAVAPNAPIGTFGRHDYAVRASVIGVRRGTQWQLFAQLSVDGFKTINAAFQIYPGAVRAL
jgi:hypothetical protein